MGLSVDLRHHHHHHHATLHGASVLSAAVGPANASRHADIPALALPSGAAAADGSGTRPDVAVTVAAAAPTAPVIPHATAGPVAPPRPDSESSANGATALPQVPASSPEQPQVPAPVQPQAPMVAAVAVTVAAPLVAVVVPPLAEVHTVATSPAHPTARRALFAPAAVSARQLALPSVGMTVPVATADGRGDAVAGGSQQPAAPVTTQRPQLQEWGVTPPPHPTVAAAVGAPTLWERLCGCCCVRRRPRPQSG